MFTELWMSGVPFALVHDTTGTEYFQLGGGNPGLATASLASTEERLRTEAWLRTNARQREQSRSATLQGQALVNALFHAVHRRRGSMQLSSEQVGDFDYHMRVFPLDFPQAIPDRRTGCRLSLKRQMCSGSRLNS